MSRSDITDKSNPPKSEWFGFKYRVTPETSKLLQEAVFKDGGGWTYWRHTKVDHTDKPFIIVRDGEITYTNDEHYFKNSVHLPEKQPPQPEPKQFKIGKYYKCIANTYGFNSGEYYKLRKVRGNLWFEGALSYVSQTCFDINSESDYNPDTTFEEKVVDNSMKENKLSHIVEVTINRDDSLSKKMTDLLTTKEVLDMSNNTQRKTVTVNLIDRDSALDEKFALVATFGEFTTSKSPEALIRSIIIDPKNKVAELIAQHNEVRIKQTNKEIMERTGNKVTLEPVEESDLYWEIR